MTVRVVQPGLGQTRHLLVVYHLSSSLDTAIMQAVGGDVLVLNITHPPMVGAYKTVQMHEALVAQVAAQVGDCRIGRVVLAGFSEGCQGVRAHLRAGEVPYAVVACDGTHAGWPIDEASVAPWRAAFERAAENPGRYAFAASHSGLTYVEKLKPPQGPYASTHSVLKRVTGMDLPLPSRVLEPVRQERGGACVWSCGGNDKDAHVRQARDILPAMLRWVWTEIGPAVAHADDDGAVMVLDGERQSLGQRCVNWSRARLGVREQPLGSNTGPEVRSYLAPCIRRDTGMHLNLKASNWCSAFACAALAACAERDEERPHGYRAAVVELVADAADTKTWRPVALARSGSWRPEVGDLAIYDRSDPAKPDTSWWRHVNRVSEWRDDGTYKAIGGNEAGDCVREAEHRLDNPRLLGFIEYPDAAHPSVVVSMSDDEREGLLAAVDVGLLGIVG